MGRGAGEVIFWRCQDWMLDGLHKGGMGQCMQGLGNLGEWDVSRRSSKRLLEFFIVSSNGPLITDTRWKHEMEERDGQLTGNSVGGVCVC